MVVVYNKVLTLSRALEGSPSLPSRCVPPESGLHLLLSVVSVWHAHTCQAHNHRL